MSMAFSAAARSLEVGGRGKSVTVTGVRGVVGRSGLRGEDRLESAAERMEAVGLYPRSSDSWPGKDEVLSGEPWGFVSFLRSTGAVASRERRAKEGEASWKM